MGRAGAAYRTDTWLKLRADHAFAKDAVLAEVDLLRDLGEEFVAEWGIFEVATMAVSKNDYLLRPDLGRSLSASAKAELHKRCPPGAQLQVAIADGLSAMAVRSQVPSLLPLLRAQAQHRGWRFGQTVSAPSRPCRRAQRHRRDARSDGGRSADRRTPRARDRGEPFRIHGIQAESGR